MYLHKNNLQKCFRHKFRYKGAKKYHLAAVSSTAAWWFNYLVHSSKGLDSKITYTTLFFQ